MCVCGIFCGSAAENWNTTKLITSSGGRDRRESWLLKTELLQQQQQQRLHFLTVPGNIRAVCPHVKETRLWSDNILLTCLRCSSHHGHLTEREMEQWNNGISFVSTLKSFGEHFFQIHDEIKTCNNWFFFFIFYPCVQCYCQIYRLRRGFIHCYTFQVFRVFPQSEMTYTGKKVDRQKLIQLERDW